MSFVIPIKDPHPGILKKIYHKIFECPTFWRIKPAFKCPECSVTYRCYWDGNDVADHGIDLCNKCAVKYETKK